MFKLLKKGKGIEIVDAEISDPNIQSQDDQVWCSNLEPGRSDRRNTDRSGNDMIESREGLLKRVELHVFSGDDVYGWIALAERFFRIGGYNEAAKLEVVSISLGGDVLSWFNSEVHRRQFRKDFKEKLVARFSHVKFRDPSQPFFAVKQTRTVAEYIHAFEDLSTQVTGLTNSQMEGIFMNGLTLEMQEVVNVCKPVDLAEMISCAYQMESSSLFLVVQREMQSGQRVNKTQYTRKPCITQIKLEDLSRNKEVTMRDSDHRFDSQMHNWQKRRDWACAFNVMTNGLVNTFVRMCRCKF